MIEGLSMKEMGGPLIHECAKTFAEIVFPEAFVKAITLGKESVCQIHLCVANRCLDAASNRAGK